MVGNWRKVGKVKDAHGLKGELQILIFSKEVPWLSELSVFALAPMDQETHLKVLQVEKAKPFKDGLILKPENILDRTQAESLKNLLFFVPEELFESEKGETIYLSEILGFEILNPQNEKIGVISGFSTNLAQDLLIVDKAAGGRAEIPFVSAFILEINFEAKSVQMQLPDGILDLDAL